MGGCQGACPYPGASPVAVSPVSPCLDARVTSCVSPTLRVVNNCPSALYLPVDYGIFPADATTGSDVEVLPGSAISYSVRDDKATKKSPQRADYSIPARLAANAITLTFNVTKD